ncbi:MAG: phosphoribosyltransferase [Dyadobacter sp.]|uniref:phosphoribosyltransferase n=1 Tax=Dyadobacter sp. TaxID=1914288 RepID=UPI001B2EA860|nr:phosphoribosyltransferase family protein [Dyadobacter sp.]MBO9616252.1 phosphoribosyltransferase [Dyadobacter sp.]
MNRSNDIIFADRKDAGEQLGRFLTARYKSADPLVMGIARGGVEVAYYVAQCLEADLNMVISRKLPVPGYPEVGFGAIAEDLSVYIAPRFRSSLEPETIGEIIDEQTDEVNRRIGMYKHGKPLPDLRGRTVIIVDDGIATGVTLVPVLRLCRNRGADRVIVAVPVAGNNFDAHLNDADALEILVMPEWFYAVGQVYASFRDLTDDELLAIVRKGAYLRSGWEHVRSLHF